LSTLVHGWYDGRDCDVPLFNLVVTNVRVDIQDGRFRVDLDIVAFDGESAGLLFPRLKRGSEIYSDDPLRMKTFVFVINHQIFTKCMEWKRKEIEKEWFKYRYENNV